MLLHYPELQSLLTSVFIPRIPIVCPPYCQESTFTVGVRHTQIGTSNFNVFVDASFGAESCVSQGWRQTHSSEVLGLMAWQ